MAVIKCPNCNRDNPSTAKYCNYCGSKINVCPKCGKVYNGDSSHCLNCGFQYNEIVKFDESYATTPRKDEGYATTSSNGSNFDDLQQMWVTRKASEKKSEIFYELFFWLFMIVAVVSIILIYVKYSTWQPNNNDSMSVAEQINSLSDYFKILTIIAAICLELSLNSTSVFLFFKENSRYKWFQTNDFNFKKFVKGLNSSALQNTTNIKDTKEIKRSAFFAYNQGCLKLLGVWCIISVLLSILIILFLINAVPDLLIKVLYLNENITENITVEQLKKLVNYIVAAGVVIGIKDIIYIVISIIIEIRQKNWIKRI